MKIDYYFLIGCILIAFVYYFTETNWIRISVLVFLAVIIIAHILSVIFKNKTLGEVTNLMAEASPI